MMGYQFVDCRWELGKPGRGRELYLESHIPGASFLDVEMDLSDLSVPNAGRHPLPRAEGFGEAAGRAGIGDGVVVVAYGNMGGAERLWWLLRHFGHDEVAVLEGGIEAWRGALASGQGDPKSMVFEPRERKGDTIAAEDLLFRLGEPGLAVVDARTPGRYRGEVEPIDPVPGHIPGAVNIPFTSGSSPQEVLEAKEIVVYCGSGVTACADLLRLAEAGRPDALLYPGSWSDWSTRGLPVETS